MKPTSLYFISFPLNARSSLVDYIDRTRFYCSCVALFYFCVPVIPPMYYASTLFPHLIKRQFSCSSFAVGLVLAWNVFKLISTGVFFVPTVTSPNIRLFCSKRSTGFCGVFPGRRWCWLLGKSCGDLCRYEVIDEVPDDDGESGQRCITWHSFPSDSLTITLLHCIHVLF